MGLKTIQAKYAASKKELETTISAFLKDAEAINADLVDYKKKLDEISTLHENVIKMVSRAQDKAKALNTHGIVQLDEVKRLLVVASQHAVQPHPVDLSALAKLERSALAEIEKGLKQEMDQYYDKIAASWPSEVKPGMMFKRGEQVIEITTPEMKSQNPNLKGDAALYHKAKIVKGFAYAGELPYARDELNPKKGWKFLKT